MLILAETAGISDSSVLREGKSTFGKTVLFLGLLTYTALPHAIGKKVSPQLAAKEEAVRSSITSTGLKCGSTQRIQLSQDANSKNTCVNFSKRKSFSCLNR